MLVLGLLAKRLSGHVSALRPNIKENKHNLFSSTLKVCLSFPFLANWLRYTIFTKLKIQEKKVHVFGSWYITIFSILQIVIINACYPDKWCMKSNFMTWHIGFHYWTLVKNHKLFLCVNHEDSGCGKKVLKKKKYVKPSLIL